MSSSDRGAPFEKRLRTLLPVRCSIDRVDRAPRELRLTFAGRRRKSVRREVSSEVMGLEIPIMAPEEERWDQTCPVFGS